MPKASHYSTFCFLRCAHQRYVKYLFTKIHEQWNTLKISLIVLIGSWVLVWFWVLIGSWVLIRPRVFVGSWVLIGSWVPLGSWILIGSCVLIGSWVLGPLRVLGHVFRYADFSWIHFSNKDLKNSPPPASLSIWKVSMYYRLWTARELSYLENN